jgi:hypothetical protein
MHTRRAWDRRNKLKAYPCFISILKYDLVDNISFQIATILVIKQ